MIEQLAAYRIAVKFRGLVHAVLSQEPCRECKDQLARASTSIVLNVAEGAGRRGRKDKRQFYVVARASARECSAILDVLLVTSVIREDAHAGGQSMLLSIVRLLSRMILNLRE